MVGEGAANLRVLVFNVKGEDLLWLDTANRFFDEEAARGLGGAGRRPRAVPAVASGRRPAAQTGDVVVPDTGGRQEGVDVFAWTPREFIDEDLLAVLLHGRRTTRGTRSRSSASACSPSSAGSRSDVAGLPGAVVLRDPPSPTARTAGRPHPDAGEPTS